MLLTGVPRSGTTLCCRLLNSLGGTLALVEPIQPDTLITSGIDGNAACLEIDEKIRQIRLSAERGIALSKHKDGQIAGNIIADRQAQKGLRQQQVKDGSVPLQRALTKQDVLVIKHNALFTALLPQITSHYEIYAVIRNPLSILASWNSVDLPVNRGRIPMGERYSPDLKQSLDKEHDVLSRQLRILDWFFGQYRRFIPEDHLIRYERVISGDLDVLLSSADGARANLENDLRLRNQNSNYPTELLMKLGQRLLESSGEYWAFYGREEVEALLS